MHRQPLVSVVMPAYKSDYLVQALDSLMQQSYTNLELIVCDDSATDDIQQIIEVKGVDAAFPVHYSKNEKRLWGFGGVEKGVKLAKGEYIKILHDDDVLKPDAISRLLQALLNNPSATLATSKRERIDEEGELLSDDLYTVNPFVGDALVKGDELVSFLADNTINFLGEPSCTLCRKADLEQFTERYTFLNGKHIAWVGDLAFYVKLLRMGDMVYLAEPQTQFRVSKQQFSQAGRDKAGVGEQGHENFRQAIRDLGWFRTEGDNNFVQVARIASEGNVLPFRSVNLLSNLLKAANQAQLAEASVQRWLAGRTLSQQGQTQLDAIMAKAESPRLAVLVVDNEQDAKAFSRTENSVKENSPAFANTATSFGR